MKITLHQGQTLWEALEEQNIILDRPCNGRGTCGRCQVHIDGVGWVKSCRFAEPGVYEVQIEENSGFAVVFSKSGSREGRGPSKPTAAVDIGTTTIAVYMRYKDQILQDSFVNPQRKFGADVISRIEAANSGKAQELQELIKSRLADSLNKLMQRMDPGMRWCQIYIGANTAMMHLLRGLSCEGLGQAPFRPADLKYAREVWQQKEYSYELHYLPGISAYIGADITSGIYGLHMAEGDRISVLLDLGTNGEMAIGNQKKLLCTSAAAGPAFEGSRLAVKIHAAGILKNLHRMLDQGIMDEYGLLSDAYFEKGYPVEDAAEGGQESEQYGSGNEAVRITQDDIREIQMAKGAIRAGIDILLEEYGVTASQVDQVYLAGGMGYYLDPEDAVAIGLLPKEFLGKIMTVGNSCLNGILRLEKESDQNGMDKLQQLIQSAEEIILADHKEFEERYIMEMNFSIQDKTKEADTKG